jgi:nucleoside-diphosphate-sugar epimerase
MANFKRVLVVGGAGYVGAVLVPKLIKAGYEVTVLDLYLYGRDVLQEAAASGRLREVVGDMRDEATVRTALEGCDAVIHLACISNDPSFELNPDLGKSINYDCFPMFVRCAKAAGINRFVYASSSSVYGVKSEPNVTEELPLEPLTDYSKYKALCEQVLLAEEDPGFTKLIVRPATVCGYSPRLRLDLTVNILTNAAVTNRKITVFGGEQMRPNLHIEDMSDLYLKTLEWPAEKIDGKIYNVGTDNLKVKDIATMVKKIVGSDVEIITQTSSDNRSYHVSSEKIKRELGFEPKRTVEDAIRDIVTAHQSGKIPDSNSDIRYYNIKTMQAKNLA